MNVFVTGGAGYIGSVCVHALVEAGHTVTVFDNLSTGHREAVDARAKFVHGCLTDAAAITAAVTDSKPDMIQHFAACAIVSESVADPRKYFRNNVIGGANLLVAAARGGVRRIVASSTCAVYGVPELLPINERAYTLPVNPYGLTKLLFEKQLLASRISFVALRYFNAAGATAQHGEQRAVETHLIPRALSGKPVAIYGTDYPTSDGTCVRDYLHVADIAAAHLRAMHRGWGCYNLGTGRGHSVRAIIAACERVTGRNIPTIDQPRRAGDPPALVACSALAQSELGWQPENSNLENIIATAWNWQVGRASPQAAARQ